MHNLKIILNKNLLTIAIDNSEFGPYQSDVSIAIETDNENTVDIATLQYGITVTVNKKPKIEKTYPLLGTSFITSDQSYLSTDSLEDINPDDICDIKVWFIYNSSYVETELTLTVPRPTKPYNSWIWNGISWISPTDYPTNNNNYRYIWDEGKLVWMLGENPQLKVYQFLRAAEYPSVQEQLDMQYWDIVNNTNRWIEIVSAIKEKYPKVE